MNFNICFALIKREYYEMRSVMLWSSVITCLILFFSVINALQVDISDQQINITQTAISHFYFIGGLVIAGFAFWEFKNPVEIRNYLLLPATPLEKIFTKVIVYSFAWLLLFICCWMVVNFSIVAILAIFSLNFKMSQLTLIFSSVFTNGKDVILETIMYQALCIFAGCYFRRYALLKLAVTYVLIILPLQELIIHESISLIDVLTENNIVTSFANLSQLKLTIELIITFILWSLSWLRLRETEAK